MTSTERRLEFAKASLQLSADQTVYWPPVEDAVRAATQTRYERVTAVLELACHPHKLDPVERLHRRADALAERSAELKNFLNAWDPLFQSLTPAQKKRAGFLIVPRVTPLVLAPY